jgi:hypothetical protein
MARIICNVANDINLQYMYSYAKMNIFLEVHSDMQLKNNKHKMTCVYTAICLHKWATMYMNSAHVVSRLV